MELSPYKKKMQRRISNPDMVELLPDIIHEYCTECKGKHRLAVVFCPTQSYRHLIMGEVFAKGGFKSIGRNELVYKQTHLLFALPDYFRLINIRPDTYFIFEEHPFESQNKEMWKIIRRWW